MAAGLETVGASLPRSAVRVTDGLGAAVWIYFGTLMMANAFGDPSGLLSLPLQFTLKDRLGLGPQSLAAFEVITFIPVYLGFAFGFLRDRWRPFGLGDRGFLLLGAPVAVACYLWLAAGELAFAPLLAGILLAMVAYQFFDVASDALLTSVAQRHYMTGRLSAVVEGTEALPGVLALFVGGWIASHASLRLPLIAAALCSLAILAHVVWYPRHASEEPSGQRSESHRAALKRLWTHQPLRAVAIVGGVWNLSLAWGTPYLFYFADQLHLSAQALGFCRAAGLACAVVVAPFYGIVCQRVALKHLLRIAIVAGLAPGFLYLVVSDVSQAVTVSVLVGLPTAFGHIALFDLLRRACPRDLEGTAITVSYSSLALSAGVGDLLGSWIYAHGGFATSLIVDAAANALVLPLLAMVPSDLISRRDGEREPVVG